MDVRAAFNLPPEEKVQLVNDLWNDLRTRLGEKLAFDLSRDEKIQLAMDLWDDLAKNPDDVPIYDWQIEKIEQSAAEFKKDPSSGLSWEEVKRRIREKHRR
jgi:putative addiction module component (TIGR02574 family)